MGLCCSGFIFVVFCSGGGWVCVRVRLLRDGGVGFAMVMGEGGYG